jgi:hypothetical protein
LHQLAFPPAEYEGFFFPTSSPTPGGGGDLMIAILAEVRWNPFYFMEQFKESWY